MGSELVKAIIVGSDIKLANEIQANMPDYIAASLVRYSEAKDKLENGIDGAEIGLLIMNVDDEPSQALTIYQHINQDPKKFRGMAVILIAADEFESHCLDFFDYGDPRFYSGSFMDSDFFIELNDALDEAQALAEQDFDDDIDNKDDNTVVEINPEKLMGMAFEISPEEGPIRVAAYGNKQIREALSSAVSHGKEQVKQVYEALEAAIEEDPSLAEVVKQKLSKAKEKTPKKVDYSDAKTWKQVHPTVKEKLNVSVQSNIGSVPEIHKSITKEKAIELLEEEKPAIRREEHSDKWSNKATNVVEQRNSTPASTYVQSADGFTTKNGYFVPRNAVQNEQNKPKVRQQQTTSKNVMKQATMNNMANSQPTILLVDCDPNTLKAFKLFLGNVYNVEMTDSSMKAIDFVIRNRVDIVAVEYNMMGVPGLSILKSIKNQPQGKSIKAFMLMDEKKRQFEIDNIKSTPGVAGVIMKPVVKKQLFYAINNS